MSIFETFVVGLLWVIFVCAVPIGYALKPSQNFSVKKSTFWFYFIPHRLVTIGALIYGAIYGYTTVILVILTVIEVIFWLLFATIKEGTIAFFILLACTIGFLITVGFANKIASNCGFYHTITYDYNITIKDGEVITEYNENIDGFKEIVDETAGWMKKFALTSYTGSVEVEHYCICPLSKKSEHYQNCSCSEKEICEFCREYYWDDVVKNIKEIQSE